MKRRILIYGGGLVLGLGIAVSAIAGFFRWENNVTLRGVAFRKVRIDEQGLAIGLLKQDTMISGRPCKRGWVHIHTNGIPSGFTAAKPIELARFTIPAGTWVAQNTDGVVTVCAFPRDTLVQGHLCRGSGGPTGVQAAFYPGGALKQYFLREDTVIQNIPCKAGVLNQSIELHENGRLKACLLSENVTFDGRPYPKGKRIHFDPEGRIQP
jgi:hypothetical protein